MRKLVILFISFLLLIGTVGCTSPDDSIKTPFETPSGKNELLTNEVRVYDIPEGVERYQGAKVTIEGTEIPLYAVKVNTSQNWVGSEDAYQRAVNGVALLELKGSVQVTVKPNVQIDYTSVIRPYSAKMTPLANLEENTLTFTLKSAGEFVLEINGNLHNTINFFVSDYGETDVLEGYENIITFPAGLHTADNNEHIAANNTVNLSSNTLVVLEDGAVVRGRFLSNNADNVAIIGRGIIDGSTFKRDTDRGSVTVPLEFNNCTNILLSDFFVLDPAGWCVNFYFIEDSVIENIKIISSRSNGDGISLQSCKNIEVDGCFLRTWDDSLVVKNYPVWSDRSVYGETEHIVFRDCTIWTDLAQSMEVGYETVGEKLEDVTFENITVMHALHLAVFSIHNGNNAEIKNITFRNITIEEANTPSKGNGIVDFRVLYSVTWSDQHAITPLGNVDGVLVENINIFSAEQFKATIGGCHDKRSSYEGDHYVDNVTIKNIALNGKRPAEAECRFAYDESKNYVRGLEYIQNEEVTVTGATFIGTQTSDELAKYGSEAKVTLVK